MQAIWQIAIGNAVAASALGLLVLIGCIGCRRRPALAHGLWLLVLLELIAPPIWRVRIPWPMSKAGFAQKPPVAVEPRVLKISRAELEQLVADAELAKAETPIPHVAP